ncbi:VWA domain-containing protein [Halodesulfurarchaeum sp. HSR-GB]|uniref:VWA domain-containing protein n=1 Tax=Halodesulfurarchaeum sp. HSR-GB TaxID=3074077 RepID=UPI0028671011|nr:VWA domain-containing protein [Halodesulfurarchaeum sp. HSR-GB]MDR5656554.1 VWA domain-containing protein [Halodesulfurarchaeum sp. HSR-GB]
MRLTPDSDPEAVAARLAGSEPRRLGAARADRLQRDARIRTGQWDLSVRIEPDHRPATVESIEPPTIVVSGDRVPQPVTNYRAEEWDLLVQRVWVAHAMAHLEYSDVADLGERLQKIESGDRPVAGAIWNALEDAAIEAAIRTQFPNYGPWFEQVRTNLLAGVGPGIHDPAGGQVYPLVHAAVLAILDGTAVDSGAITRLLDPADSSHHFYTAADRRRFVTDVLPVVTETAESITTISDPVERNRQAIACFEAIRPAIAAARADGRAQVAAREDAWGMPDDAARSQQIGSPAPLPAVDRSEHDQAGDAVREESPVSSAGEVSPVSDADVDNRAVEIDPEADPTDVETVTDEQLADDLAAEVAAGRDRDGPADRAANIEHLQEAVSAAESELESTGVVVPTDDPTPHEPTARAAREDGTRLARVLRNRFQKDRKRSTRRNQRRGRLDPAALHRTATGDRRVKQRRERPDESDHHCLFVLDRSGSMRQHVRVAERAMGMLAVALEAVDVEVSVLELLDKEVRLAKPADRTVEQSTGRLYHGDAGGGTPLTDTLHIARELLKAESGTRFVIVVTDGRPSDPNRYREALSRFTVPVLGVNLTTEAAAGESEFHRQVTVAPETRDLRRALRQLVQEVLFE